MSLLSFVMVLLERLLNAEVAESPVGLEPATHEELSISESAYAIIPQFGEVTEWLMVPLSKSGVQQCTVGSNPTLSAERCWSGRSGAPGERVSRKRPWVRIPPSPPPHHWEATRK